MKNRQRSGNFFLNLLTATLIILSITFTAVTVIIYQSPFVIINPFPPIEPTIELPFDIVAAALTKTLQNLPIETTSIPPSQTTTTTPLPTSLPTAAPTQTTIPLLTASSTPDPSQVRFSAVPVAENVDQFALTITPKPYADYLYEFVMLKEARFYESPLNDFVSNPLLNCKWIGVGGQVFDFYGRPLPGAGVKLGGTYPDTTQFIEQYTTTAEEHMLGEGGYDFPLGNKPFISSNAFWVQVIDENGEALSAKARFSTTIHCNLNLIRIDFIQVK
jgi:hypothetical protein